MATTKPVHSPGAGQTDPRPRLSPKSLNDSPGDYFPPPTPASERPQPAWSPFVPADAPSRRADENGVPLEVADTRRPNDAGGASSAGTGEQAGEAGAAGAQTGTEPAAAGWPGQAPPSFALSPSSSAFNANFAHLMRGPPTGAAPPTPLHAPSAPSPFFPGPSAPASTSSDALSGPDAFPSAAHASHSASAVPATPGPSTTAGLSFPPPTSFSFSSGLALPARRLAGRPTSLGPRSASATSTPAANASRYTLFNPQTLFSVILSSIPLEQPPDPSPLLILDIRTHTAFVTERLTNSINICVPSTLLRRPAFGIDRVAEGLSPAEQATFEKWNSAHAIVVLDTESTALVEGGGIASLLSKFDKAGFQGKLGWVKGGWYAVRTQLRGMSQAEQDKLVVSGLPDGAATESAPTTAQGTPLDGIPPGVPTSRSVGLTGPPARGGEAGASTPSKKHGRPVLQVRDLPAAAFQLASTSAFRHTGDGGRAPAPGGGSGLPTSRRGVDIAVTSPSTDGSLSSIASQRPNMGKRRKSGFEGEFQLGTPTGGALDAPSTFGLDKANAQPSRGVNGAGQRGSGFGQSSASAANPFFDNIRQNSEALSLERSLQNLSPIELPHFPSSLIPSLPPFLQSLVLLSPMSRADRLARQFYELESAERERLEGTFRWHAKHGSSAPAAEAVDKREGARDSAKSDEEDEAKRWKKFGISAGFELGNLNRFKNIFPYEHSRVKLTQHSPSATDYVNASHLYLRDSSKRFIASQGPLPSTFRDFWQMCEQESVGVIIMLTNLKEGGREKCGRYWIPQRDAEWDVQVEGDLAHEEEDRIRKVDEERSAANAAAGGGGFFSDFDAAKTEDKKEEPVYKDSTIRRTFNIRRLARRYPDDPPPAPPRKIRHIQYRAWPDFDIPAEPADVVSLVAEVDAAQRDYMREIGWDPVQHDGLEPPILAHCSAGVGRTGVFIMVSSLLEKLRRDRQAQRASGKPAPAGDAMDVDGPPAPEAASPPRRPSLLERLSSDPETSQLTAGLSHSSLDGPPHSPVGSSFARSHQQPPPSSSGATGASSSTAAPEHPPLPSLDVPALAQSDPIYAGVNELREQRMSMVANFRQYVCVLECVLEGAVRMLQDEQR
ncbi:uncharacterized protein JCM10292_003964 [Rhodotorula paludigena]|uniref:uncharacterized protein n=1 Tax=Rhodotorula paludigena TaxID=86838 RepID=UPI003176D14F